MAFFVLPAPRRRPLLGVESLEARDVPATLTVDDSFTGPLPANKFTTIQAAVNAAAPDDTISVRAGTYAEEVIVAGPAKSGLKLVAQGNNVTITTAAGSGTPFALVNVDGAQRVVIDGFRIAGPVAVADLGAGILVDNGGSATVRNNRISDIAAGPVSGDQFGNAVQVGGTAADGTPTAGTATVENNTIVRYQKTGVAVFNPGSSAVVRNNTVVGVGPTGVVAQNGVQVSAGAAATVTGNTVSGNNYLPAGTESAGVLVSGAGGVTVSGNRLFGNEVGVLIEGQFSPALVSGNSVVGSARDGVAVFQSAGVAVVNNQISGSGRDGVRLDGVTASLVALNRVTASSDVGVRVVGPSAFNLVTLNRLTGNGRFDALDTTTGAGTAGTADFWLFNTIGVSGTPGLR